VELGYVAWDSEIASTNVLKTVLEDEGFDVTITDVSASLMYQGVAEGDFDAMVAAWLPTTQADYMEEYGDDLVDLGPNLSGTLIGLVVPADAPIDSIEDLNESNYADGVITGIEPGAGIMRATLDVIDSYDLDYELVEGSGATMTAELKDAIDNGEEVIVTGWTPHWKFARWDLKYLEDPQGIYGGEEQIHTLVREGFESDNPDAFKIISNFAWTPADMEEVMLMIADGTSAEDAARDWVDSNPDKVAAWLE
jgi:glycine betaine/proline transport system substrate-binding protein